jgi:putative phage-type endonuclease
MTLSPERKGRVTGSAVGAILGLNPWMTQQDVMRRMVRDWHGAEPEFTGNVATEYGSFHEAGALTDFEMQTGYKVLPAKFFKYDDWLGATPDGLVGDDATVEVKCPYSLRDQPEPMFKSATDQPHYYAQMQIEMLCSGRSKCYFWQWAPNGWMLQLVYIDGEWLSDALLELRDFYDRYLIERESPAEHLAPMRRVIESASAHKLLEEYDDLTEVIERATQRKKECLEELVSMAKEQDAEINGRKLTKVERAGSIAYAKALKELCPDADLTKWTGKPSSHWRLS